MNIHIIQSNGNVWLLILEYIQIIINIITLGPWVWGLVQAETSSPRHMSAKVYGTHLHALNLLIILDFHYYFCLKFTITYLYVLNNLQPPIRQSFVFHLSIQLHYKTPINCLYSPSHIHIPLFTFSWKSSEVALPFDPNPERTTSRQRSRNREIAINNIASLIACTIQESSLTD